MRLTRRRIEMGIAHPIEAARRVGQHVSADLAFRFSNGRSLSPRLVVMVLGARCNLRCQMCPQWGERGTSKDLSAETVDRELTVESLRAFVADLAASRPLVHLTGGETMLMREFAGIVRLLRSHGLRVSLTTNGTLLERHAESLVELGISEVVVSVDGPEALHDSIRGVDGTFARLIAGIEALDSARQAAGADKPTIATTTTISAANVHCLPELVETLGSKPVDRITIQHLWFASPEVLKRNRTEFARELGIDSDAIWRGLPQEPGIQTDALLESLRAVSRISLDHSQVRFLPAFNEEEVASYYEDASYVPQRLVDRCLFPWLGLMVYPDGEIIACPGYRVGNIETDLVSDVWNGPEYRRIRRSLKSKRAFPICSRCCWFYHHSV